MTSLAHVTVYELPYLLFLTGVALGTGVGIGMHLAWTRLTGGSGDGSNET